MRLSSFSIGFHIWVLLLCFFLGAALGSFMNCIAGRMVRHEDWIHGRSKCDACGHVLGWRDLIPVFSYVFSRGRCRYCGEKIPSDCLWTEAGLGLLFVVFAEWFGLSMAAVRAMGLASILLGLSLVDLASYEIPDGFIIAGIVWWAVCLPFMGGSIWSLVKDGLLGGLVIAGGMLAFSLLFDKITGKDSMGGGDIKLYFMVSLYLGLAQGFLNLILSCIVGLLFVLLLHRQKIPFGPSISISTLVCLMVGLPIVSWYFSLF